MTLLLKHLFNYMLMVTLSLRGSTGGSFILSYHYFVHIEHQDKSATPLRIMANNSGRGNEFRYKSVQSVCGSKIMS